MPTYFKFTLILVGIYISLIAPTFALQSIPNLLKNNTVITLTAGVDRINAGSDQVLTQVPPLQNRYTKANGIQNIAGFGGFIGIEQPIYNQILIQVGIALYGDNEISTNGDVWYFNHPLFNDLAYSYKISQQRYLLSSKLMMNLNSYPRLHPYFSAETGISNNKAYDYVSFPKVPDVVSPEPFQNNKNTSYAWGAGLGLDYDWNKHLRVGVGYQYTSLGKVSLGRMPEALTPESLHFNLYANQFRFQLTGRF